MLSRPVDFLLVLIGLYLTGGCANALNQYFESDIDARMTRTAKRRPLPSGQISPANALIFSITIGVIGVIIFAVFFNLLTAALSLGTILFYSLFYTLYLKPNTDQNIVIGGIAGAMAPVGAWTAATGTIDIFPWLLFALICIWTPPHFWALAMFCQDDYRKAELPMLPVVRGEKAAMKQILIYTIILLTVSMSLLVFGAGWFYLVFALILGGMFLRKVLIAYKDRSEKNFKALFGYSIIYLFGLFTAIMVDKVLM